MHPHEFFRNGRRTAGRIGQVRSRSYDVLKGTASDRLSKDIVFSATDLAIIDCDGDIMHDLGQKMTTSNLWHCILTFQRSSEITDLD